MTTAAYIEPSILGSAGGSELHQVSVAAGSGLAGGSLRMAVELTNAQVPAATDLRIRWANELAALTAEGSASEVDRDDLQGSFPAGFKRSGDFPDLASQQPTDAAAPDAAGGRNPRSTAPPVLLPANLLHPIAYTGETKSLTQSFLALPTDTDRPGDGRRAAMGADTVIPNVSTSSRLRRPNAAAPREVPLATNVTGTAAAPPEINLTANVTVAEVRQVKAQLQSIPADLLVSTVPPVSGLRDASILTNDDGHGLPVASQRLWSTRPVAVLEVQGASEAGKTQAAGPMPSILQHPFYGTAPTFADSVADAHVSPVLPSQSSWAGDLSHSVIGQPASHRAQFGEELSPLASRGTETAASEKHMAGLMRGAAEAVGQTSPTASLLLSPSANTRAEDGLTTPTTHTPTRAIAALDETQNVDAAVDSTSELVLAGEDAKNPTADLLFKNHVVSGGETGGSNPIFAVSTTATPSSPANALGRVLVTTDIQLRSGGQQGVHPMQQGDQLATVAGSHISTSPIATTLGEFRSRAVLPADRPARAASSSSAQGSSASGWMDGSSELGGLSIRPASSDITDHGTFTAAKGDGSGESPFQRMDEHGSIRGNGLASAGRLDPSHAAPFRGSSLAVGYQDPVLGYVELHAQSSVAGIHASLVANSEESGTTLAGHLASLSDWMHERHAVVESLSIVSPGRSGDTRAQSEAGGGSNSSESYSGTRNESGAGQQDLMPPPTVSGILDSSDMRNSTIVTATPVFLPLEIGSSFSAVA